jgi:hypothetical protein
MLYISRVSSFISIRSGMGSDCCTRYTMYIISLNRYSTTQENRVCYESLPFWLSRDPLAIPGISALLPMNAL